MSLLVIVRTKQVLRESHITVRNAHDVGRSKVMSYLIRMLSEAEVFDLLLFSRCE